MLLVWFGYDNVIGWFASPILFWPLMMLGAIASILYSMGILGILFEVSKPAIKGTVNSILAKTPIGLRL